MIYAIAIGSIHSFGAAEQTCFLLSAAGLPVFPLALARLFCIPRNKTTNMLFRTVSGGSRILKYDVVIVIAALIFGGYATNVKLSSAVNVIRSSYYWVLNHLRSVIGFRGTDGILHSLAEKLGINQIWFNDVSRLAVVFLIYTVFVAVLRRRKEA